MNTLAETASYALLSGKNAEEPESTEESIHEEVVMYVLMLIHMMFTMLNILPHEYRNDEGHSVHNLQV